MARLEQQDSRRLSSTTSTIPGIGATLGTSLAGPSTLDDTESIMTIKGPVTDAQTSRSGDQRQRFEYSFDQDLNTSRPYTRALQRHGLLSTTSSEIHTMGWSCLSGLSLAEISNISVINLLFCPQDLWNGHHYSEVRTDHDGVILSYHRSLLSYHRSHLKSEEIQAAPTLRRRQSTRVSLHSGHMSETLSPKNEDKAVPVAARTMLLSGMFPPRFTNGPCCDFRAVNDSNLLGPQLSGKTTVYNHLQILYGNGITELERLTAFELVIRNLVDMFTEAWLLWSDLFDQKPDREVRRPVTYYVVWWSIADGD